VDPRQFQNIDLWEPVAP